jgi:type II secretory pathway component PulF
VDLTRIIKNCIIFTKIIKGGLFMNHSAMPSAWAWISSIIFYLYFSYSLYVIAQKTGNEANAWMAWIPIVNAFLMLQIAGEPMWWFILLLIPIVNIVIGIIVWMKIAEARNKPDWWGLLLLVPFVNIIVPGYLAFSD